MAPKGQLAPAGPDAEVDIVGGADNEVDFAKISIPEAFKLLNATPHGLTEAEAAKRLEEFGPNKLPETSVSPVLRFLGYLWNPLSWAMEVAAILAIILLDYADFALIVALLLLNATISFVEESNADKAIKALAGALAPKCKVLRDKQVRGMDAVEIVPGDILLVRLGDIVPADIKILGEHAEDEEEAPMQIDQAALTGESLPVKKFSGDTAFSGSTVKQGERHAVVYATGVNTFFGRAAALIGSTNNVANIQKVMSKIGAMCLITIGIWVVIELGVQFGAYGHSCYTGEGRCPTVTNILVIIVGGIPIAMPTVLSVTLALGAYQLAKHGAIVARMSAVEEMAGMDILCSDKTGTLTLNKLSIDLSASFPMGGTDVNTLVKYGALSADVGSEEAIDVVLHNTYPDPDGLWKGYRRLKFIPFNPNDKFTMAVIEDERTGQVFRLMKGAPQVVLKRAYDFAEIHAPVEQKIIEYANRGYRALGFGIASGAGAADAPGTKWEFLGLLPLFDPPRHDTAETIERCLEKGISVKMVTGDQQLIGKETARQLGMGTNIHKIEVLLHAKAGTGLVEGHSNVDELVEGADGFAEVFPEHKFEIVRILQDRNHMVGMTGDGVNDAPALKKADVGIAVHGATEAARGAADIVLTEPGLSVIVEAVIGARKIFQRMTTYAKYTVAMTFRICFTFGILTIAYNWYFPTILIVLLAVFNDGAMIALSKDRVQPSPMPNSWRLRDIFIIGIVYGLYLTISTWVLYHVASHGIFFQRDVHMFSLNVTPGELIPFCTQLLAQRGITNVNAPMSSYAAQLGQQYATVTDTALSQCMVEQRYVRGAQLRALIYNQVSVSGQALVFVVRTARHSFLDRAGGMTYLAFFAAQVASTLIAAFGFNGYDPPAEGITNCQLCVDSTFNYPHFWPSRTVPIASTESVYTASVIGCTYWIVVAWIWSIIWYMALDPIKWLLMWLLNEEGWRDKHIIRDHLTRRRRHPAKTGEEHYVQVGAAAANHLNPMGRASLQKVDPHTLSRASVIKIETGPQGLRRVSAGPYRLSLEAQQQQFGNLAPGATLANPHPIRRVSLTGRGSFSGEVPNATSRRGSMESVGGHPYRRGSAESIGMRGSSERAGLQMGQAAGHGPSQNGATQKPAGGV